MMDVHEYMEWLDFVIGHGDERERLQASTQVLDLMGYKKID